MYLFSYIKRTAALWFIMSASVLITGVTVGIVVYTFLEVLELVTEFREKHTDVMLSLLPLTGLFTAFAYKKISPESRGGNLLIAESVRASVSIPAAMPALTYVFAVLSHTFGASVGREGAGVQIGASMSYQIGKLCRVPAGLRHIITICGMSAGFSAIFGTPLAGVFFGMEYCRAKYIAVDAFAPAMIASLTADAVVRFMGHGHELYMVEAVPPFSFKTAAAVAVAALLFGGAGNFFGFCTVLVRNLYAKLWKNEYLRGFCAAAVAVLTAFLLGLKEYGGLSTWLIGAGFGGAVSFIDPLKKFVFTALSIGGGLIGGEVTPLFCVGSSIGGAFANIFGLPPSLFAAMGLVTAFGAFMNTPVTAVIIGVELFSGAADVNAAPYFAVSSVIGIVFLRNIVSAVKKVAYVKKI